MISNLVKYDPIRHGTGTKKDPLRIKGVMFLQQLRLKISVKRKKSAGRQPQADKCNN